MRETEAEVLARIEATRARMGDTIDRIGDRVNPDRVQAELKARAREQVREAKATVKHKARSAMRDMEDGVSDAGRGLWNTIRENPIPAGMVGVGVAWLLANGATDDDHEPLEYGVRPRGRLSGARRGYGYAAYNDLEPGYDVRDRARTAGMVEYELDYEADDQGMMDRAQKRVEDAADSVRDRASETKDRAVEKASELKHRASHRMDEMQHRAGSAARQAGYKARRAERRVEDAVRDNPLAAGAIAAALGFAAGMMIPESDREHEMFGPTRDRMMHKAERKVREAGTRAKQVAKETAGQMKETARENAKEAMGSSSNETSGASRPRAAVTEPGR